MSEQEKRYWRKGVAQEREERKKQKDRLKWTEKTNFHVFLTV